MKQSRDVFYREIEFFKNTGTILSSAMLDGAFQNLLYLDIILGNGRYPEDVKLYYDFLDQVEMNEEMQDFLAGNIIYFQSLMSNKWYRPLFLEFITHIENRGFLTRKESLNVLESAFVSWESYEYHDDQQISQMMEAYLAASYERKYSNASLIL